MQNLYPKSQDAHSYELIMWPWNGLSPLGVFIILPWPQGMDIMPVVAGGHGAVRPFGVSTNGAN